MPRPQRRGPGGRERRPPKGSTQQERDAANAAREQSRQQWREDNPDAHGQEQRALAQSRQQRKHPPE